MSWQVESNLQNVSPTSYRWQRKRSSTPFQGAGTFKLFIPRPYLMQSLSSASGHTWNSFQSRSRSKFSNVAIGCTLAALIFQIGMEIEGNIPEAQEQLKHSHHYCRSRNISFEGRGFSFHGWHQVHNSFCKCRRVFPQEFVHGRLWSFLTTFRNCCKMLRHRQQVWD